MTDIKVIHAFQLSKARHEGVADSDLMRIAESAENRKLEPEDYLHQFMISCISNWTIGENIGIAPDKLSKTDKITSVCERIVEISELPGQDGWGKANFATHNRQLYIYRHNHSQRLPERFISRLIKAAGLQLRLHQSDYLNVKFAEACEEQILHSAKQATLPPKDAVYINVLNGVLQVLPNGTKRLLQHTPNIFFSYCLPYCYDESEAAPDFQDFLNEVLPEREAQMCLLEFIGSCFFSNKFLKIEKGGFLIGEGENGKSVVYDIIRGVLGASNISGLTLAEITNSKFMLPYLEGKLMNWSSDIGRSFEEDIFKRLTSQEIVTAEVKYGKSFEMQQIPRLLFNGNEMVTSKDKSKGLERRLLIFPFKVHIPKSRQNPMLAQLILTEESPGILNLIIAALHRLINQQTFTESKMMNAALEEWRTDHNSAVAFIDASGMVASNQTMKFSYVYSKYVEWCYDSGAKAMENNEFNKELRKRFKDKKKGNYCWFATFDPVE
ncbi:phage/plasmid primase, P4 family [Flavobacteriales bacterium]|nr:phage/plasmid primase, P4 family [Flavobacteriales bacterium]